MYRVDLDPVDVPLLTDNPDSEGVLLAFEAYSDEPGDYGYIGVTEVTAGVYPSAALPLSVAPVKVYEPSGGQAGNLGLGLPESRLAVQTLLRAGAPGVLPQSAGPEMGVPIHSEGAFGITMDSSSVDSQAIAVLSREFDPGNAAQRVRVEEGKQYMVRFHVTSTHNSADNAQLYLKARAARFGWVQSLILGGAWAAGSDSNHLAQQILPGAGCLNPEKDGGENGGWYTVLMHTPLSKEIRADGDQELSIEELMPALATQPGPGNPSSSFRDLKVGAGLVDTISNSADYWREEGNFTIDRIEVRVFDAVVD